MLEEANQQGGVPFKFKDGPVKKCNIIVLSLSEDIEGKVPKAVIPTNFCFRCFNGYKHFGSAQPFHICGEGPLGTRTPLKTFKILIELLKNQSVQSLLTETDERATSLGMKHFKVVNQLLAFSHCFGEGGVYAAMNYDDLHMLFLGLFVLILSAADVLFCRYFKRTQTMQTYEDVHDCVEFLVGLCPGMNDGVHILKPMKMGWFRLESWNGVDTECFLSHLLFVFSTHDSLIEDEDIRLAFADIVNMVYSLYVRFKVKKFYREHETEQLGEDIAFVLSKLQALFELKVDDSADSRTMESEFVFAKPVPLRNRSKFYKANTRHDEEFENVSEKPSSSAGDNSVAPSEAGNSSGKSSSAKTSAKKSSEALASATKPPAAKSSAAKTLSSAIVLEDEDEPEMHFTVHVDVNDLSAATLGGNQTRTHKVHAFTMIPEQIKTLGSLDVSSTRIFETQHRLVKAYTRTSNKAKLEATERQVIRNSVSAVHRPVCSIKSRLYKEKHSSNDPAVPGGIVSPVEEESDEEEIAPVPFIHTGTGR